MISPNSIAPEMQALLLQLLAASDGPSSSLTQPTPPTDGTSYQRTLRPTRPTQASAQSHSMRPSQPTSSAMTTAHVRSRTKATIRASAPNHAPISITLDTSTRIMGHCNTIHLPTTSSTVDPSKLATMITLALRNNPQAQGRPVDIKVNDGVNVCGSKNTIVLAADTGAASKGLSRETEESATEVTGTDPKVVKEEVVVGMKRKAEDGLVESPHVKRTAAVASE